MPCLFFYFKIKLIQKILLLLKLILNIKVKATSPVIVQYLAQVLTSKYKAQQTGL